VFPGAGGASSGLGPLTSVFVSRPQPSARPSGGEQPAATTLRRATNRLREQVLALDTDGAFLGSEDDLQAWLGVSRPTLRQVARILEREQLLTVRRGVNGGLFSQRPSGQAVADMAAVYLRSVRTTLHDMVRMQGVLSREAVELAARNPSAEQRAGLLAWVEASESDERLGDTRRFHELVIEFGRVLGAITDSPTLGLLTDVVLTLATTPVGVRVFEDPDRIRQARAYQLELARAIADGDVRRALECQRRQQELSREWIGPGGHTAAFGPRADALRLDPLRAAAPTAPAPTAEPA
jgi:GntR family transcriptional regulator, transcriptional repressor for pyruvate dehydrogenase complex